MFRNYLKIALRNLRKHKGYSSINVMGLAVGMACFVLIMALVQNELSYDRFHEKRDQIYKLMRIEKIEGRLITQRGFPAPLAPELRKNFPEILNTVRISRTGWIAVHHKDKSFIEKRILLVDPSFFEVFTFALVQGSPKTALEDKYSVVLTEETATKYFGEEDPIGKTVTYDNRIDLKVTSVAKNVPQNTDFKFDIVVSFKLINEVFETNYLDSRGAFNFATYVLVRKDFLMSEFGRKSIEFCKKFRPDDRPDFQLLHSLFLQPITKTHIESNVMVFIYIFSAIAFIILLLACINFMNLSVAQFAARAREVGMRKVIGANRFQLIKQFLGESILLSLVALPLAICMVELLVPLYNTLLNINFTINYIQNWPFSVGLFATALFVGIISGSYPAFYASAIQPIKSLKSTFQSGPKSSVIKRALVIFQFSVSIILIIGTIIIHNQLHYMRNTNLGFNKDYVVNIPLYERKLRSNYENFKKELLKNPRILLASGNYFMSSSYRNSIRWEGMKENDEMFMNWFEADTDFIDTFQIELIEGRNFRKDSPSDAKFAYLLNESAVKALGWESAVGKQFELERADSEMGTVIGIIKDFHFQSLRRKIEPLAICMGESFGIISLRIIPDGIPDTLGFVKYKLREYAPNAPFEYYFLDSNIDDMYRLEVIIGKIFNHFSFLAIFIACLGLLGLTSYSIIQRTREIGIRKVLGAPASSIVVLLTKEFTRWMIIANIIAWPVAYFAMSSWLQNFAYRINIGIWTFLLAAALALGIALFTVSFQAIKAALVNPVEVLRYE